MTGPTPSPFPLGEFGNARNSADRQNDAARRLLRDQLKKGAEEYTRLVGAGEILKQMNKLKAVIETMNGIQGGTTRLSMPTIDAMLIAVSIMPDKVGFDIATRPAFKDFQFMLYAVKLQLEKERDAKVKQSGI